MSNPVSIQNWEAIQHKLCGLREQVYRALLAAGPQTTCDLAAIAALPLLTVRPRVTELCELGLAESAGRRGRHGLYRALPLHCAPRPASRPAPAAPGTEDLFQCQLQLL